MSALLAPYVVRSDGLVGSANKPRSNWPTRRARHRLCGSLGPGTQPVLIPYASSLTNREMLTGAVISIAPLGRILGGVVMPVLADRLSRKYVVWASTGSSIAYGLSSTAAVSGGILMLLLGRMIGGVFGETKAMLTAYLMELTMPDMPKFKRRQTMLMTMNWGAGLVLTPLGGLLATFGLNVPFIVSMAGSLTGLAFSLLFMNEVHEIKR